MKNKAMIIKNLIYEENHALLFQNPEVASAITEIAIYNEYPKKHLLCKEGTVCDSFYIITSGITRMFYNKEGMDVTIHFSTENEAAGVYESFAKRNKSKFSIETLEPVIAYKITYDNFNKLLNENAKVERYFRFFIQKLHINLIERINDSYFYNAKERYEKFFSQKPELFQKVPLKYIASYLNITPETLSRIRNN